MQIIRARRSCIRRPVDSEGVIVCLDGEKNRVENNVILRDDRRAALIWSARIQRWWVSWMSLLTGSFSARGDMRGKSGSPVVAVVEARFAVRSGCNQARAGR